MHPLKHSLPIRLKHIQSEISDWFKSGTARLDPGDEGFCSAPSNIALIKYWGKQENKTQIPTNSSLSYSLSGFRTHTNVICLRGTFPRTELQLCPQMSHRLNWVSLENKAKSARQDTAHGNEKVNLFLTLMFESISPEVCFDIYTKNTFPTGCGIASSASGFAALVGAVADVLHLKSRLSQDDLCYWMSQWSRIGSGSATRSSLASPNPWVAWETSGSEDTETQTHTVQVHENLEKLQHCVVVFDAAEKLVSSSKGHEQASTSPFFELRRAMVKVMYNEILLALEQGDFASVQRIAEQDAWNMHAVMATGTPPLLYPTQKTMRLLADFIAARNIYKFRVLWTLDAGPNIHFLGLEKDWPQFYAWIKNKIDAEIERPEHLDSKVTLIFNEDRANKVTTSDKDLLSWDKSLSPFTLPFARFRKTEDK